MSQEKIDPASDPTIMLCKAFLQFEIHGAIADYNAHILVAMGFLASRKCMVPPLSTPTLVYKISKKGRKQSEYFWELWKKWYVARYAIEDDGINDVYATDASSEILWAFSKERLDKERKAGRLSQAIKRSL